MKKWEQFNLDIHVHIRLSTTTSSLVPRLDESESGELSSLFCAKAGMLAQVLVCNYAREYYQTWMTALVVYLKLLKRPGSVVIMRKRIE